MQLLRESLQSGAWLTRERIRLIAVAVLIASVGGLLFLVVTANGARASDCLPGGRRPPARKRPLSRSVR